MNILSLDWELILNICKQLDNYIYCIRLLITCKQFYDNEILKKLIIEHFSEIKINKYGSKYWYLNGKLHREDGPAVEYSDRDKEWYLNGKRHREDGPAIEYSDGDKSWYLNGKCHREDGPAVENADGYKAWYLNGKQISEYEFNKIEK